MNIKMKDFNLLFLTLALSNTMAWAQPINHSQELSNLISQKKWFEIENYYQQHKESIDSDFGNSIFKYCKKATFDFDNMVFSVDK